jgi:HSP20 family molecular chaperone IbpA
LLRAEPELMRPIYLRLYETEETLIAKAEVPGYTEKELNVICEPWRLVITGKREYKEENKIDKRDEAPIILRKDPHLQDRQAPAGGTA